MQQTQTKRDKAASIAKRPRKRSGRARVLVVLLVPFFAFFMAFFIAPIVFAIVDSMYSLKTSGLGYGEPERIFVYFDNYKLILSDPIFLKSLGTLGTYALIQVPLMVVTALVLALLLSTGRAFAPKMFRVIFFIPYGVPGVVATLLWGFMYVPATSPVLQIMAKLGFDMTPLNSDSVLFAIANISLWVFAGYNMLILAAALDAIPAELYEAAQIDGATQWHIVREIKLPLLRPSIVLITVFTIIGTLQLFVEPLVLKPLTTAITSDFSPNLAAYNQAFAQNNRNLAAAMAVVVAMIAFIFSFGFLKSVNRRGKEAW